MGWEEKMVPSRVLGDGVAGGVKKDLITECKGWVEKWARDLLSKQRCLCFVKARRERTWDTVARRRLIWPGPTTWAVGEYKVLKLPCSIKKELGPRAAPRGGGGEVVKVAVIAVVSRFLRNGMAL